MLVEMDEDLIRAALDHMSMANSSTITIQIVNGRCVAIDTEASTKKPLKALPAPSASPAPQAPKSAISLESLTESVILDSINDGFKTAFDISERLDIARKDSPRRGKISRLLGKLRTDGKIVLVGGGQGQQIYAIADKPQQMPLTKNQRPVPRGSVTEPVLYNLLSKNGPLLSKDISDKLGIPRNDASVRSKVSAVLGDLVRALKIEKILDPIVGAPPRYRIKEAAKEAA